MYKNVELRKLPSDVLCKVVNILEINDDWKKMMSIIPKSLQVDTGETKYNNEHIRLIEEHAKSNNLKCTEILIDEWGTSGRVRPSLTHLKNILSRAQIYRAADEIATMLEESTPIRPSFGPAAPITTNVTEILNEEQTEKSTKEMKESEIVITEPITIQNSYGNRTTQPIAADITMSDMMKFSESQTKISMNVPALTIMNIDTNIDVSKKGQIEDKGSNDIQYPDYQLSFPNIPVPGIDSSILQDQKLLHFEYKELERITGNFSDVLSYGTNGLKGRIGSGGFGDVYVGNHPTCGFIAIKKAHIQLQSPRKPDIAMKVFNAEVKFLSQFRHINIVPIIGISRNGLAPCIVCEYIAGGSLQQNIAAKILSETQRINIMTGTAEGLKYLHTSKAISGGSNSIIMENTGDNDSQNTTLNFVHGDVKTANILLTIDCVPKLCDFGLAKQFDATYLTTCPMGTKAYMAPEGNYGTITQKIDIFSFGIVLLELLTGLKPIFVVNNENIHIKLYVEENAVNNDITTLLDKTVKPWTRAKEIYSLASSCLQYDRKSRPNITEVCDILNNIKN